MPLPPSRRPSGPKTPVPSHRGKTPWRQPPARSPVRAVPLRLSLTLVVPVGLSMLSLAFVLKAFAGYVDGLQIFSRNAPSAQREDSASREEVPDRRSIRVASRPVVEGTLEDPTGTALSPFFMKLSALGLSGQDPVATVLQLGDSHTAADFFTGQVRRRLQERFGDAGRGLLYPGRAFKYYVQRDVKHGSSGPWISQLGLRQDAKEPLGLGGVRMSASSPDASLYLETCAGCFSGSSVSAFELAFWQRPDGGPIQVLVDGQPERVIDTSGRSLFGAPTLPEPLKLPPGAPQLPRDVLLDTWMPTTHAIESPLSIEGATGYARVEVPPGPHRLEIKPTGDGPVDLFWIGMENPGPGVRLDALGINGAWIGNPARWEWSLAIDQLRRRNPALLTFWYGTNESTMNPFDATAYQNLWLGVVGRMREAVPEAACLLIGPVDRVVRSRKDCRPKRDRRGNLRPLPEGCGWRPLESIRTITEIERAVAFKSGCAFWDTQTWMGGPGALERWVQASPPLAQADRVHLTRDGYERLGNALADLLLQGYSRFQSESSAPAVSPGALVQPRSFGSASSSLEP